jgi:hypothetical protein
MKYSRSNARPPFDVWLGGFVAEEPSSSVDAALQTYIREYGLAVRESLNESVEITDIRTRLAILEESGLLDPANSRDADLRRYADCLRSSLGMYSCMSPAAQALLAKQSSEKRPRVLQGLREWVEDVFRYAMRRTGSLHPIVGVPLWWLCWVTFMGFVIGAAVIFLAVAGLSIAYFYIGMDWLFHKLF